MACSMCGKQTRAPMERCYRQGCPGRSGAPLPPQRSPVPRNPVDAYQEPLGEKEGLHLIEKLGWGVIGFLICLIFIGWLLMK